MSQKERDAFMAGYMAAREGIPFVSKVGATAIDHAKAEALRRYPDETPAPAGQIGCPYYCEGSHVEGERCNCPCHKDETAWLVETADSGPAWWTGTGWTSDSLKAVRYATRDQAEYAAKALGAGTFASEHRWFPSPPEAARRWRCKTCDWWSIGYGGVVMPDGVRKHPRPDRDMAWCGPVVEDRSAGT